jgi:hypothetical protein
MLRLLNNIFIVCGIQSRISFFSFLFSASTKGLLEGLGAVNSRSAALLGYPSVLCTRDNSQEPKAIG